jgi:hypothetical protein
VYGEGEDSGEIDWGGLYRSHKYGRVLYRQNKEIENVLEKRVEI